MPLSQRILDRSTFRINNNRQKGTESLHTWLNSFMPPVPARLHFPVGFSLKLIKIISLLLGEFRRANQKILTANTTPIPNMVDNTFAGPELIQANGTLRPRKRSPLDGFGTMRFEFVHSKSLLSSKRNSTKVTIMIFIERGNRRRSGPLSNYVCKLKRACFHHKLPIQGSNGVQNDQKTKKQEVFS